MGIPFLYKLIAGLSFLGLASMVALFWTAFSYHRKLNKKRFAGYSFASLAAAVGSGSLGNLLPNDEHITYLIFLMIFLIFGAIHSWIMHKSFSRKIGGASFALGLLYTIFIAAIAGATFILIQHFLWGISPKYSAWLATALIGFPIPYMFINGVLLGTEIPDPIYKPWYYPILLDEQPEIDYSKLDKQSSLILLMELPKKFGSHAATTDIRVRAPQDIIFGNFIYAWINEYNEKNPNDHVEYQDENGNPYGWSFFVKKSWWKGNKRIDPDLRIYENRLKEIDFIIARRVTVKEL